LFLLVISMRYYAIAPRNGLSVIKDYTHFLVVAQWLRDQKYRVFFKSKAADGAQIILDNGAYEYGEAMQDDEFLLFAAQLKPTIVVAPDVFRDYAKTIQRVEGFFKLVNDRCLESQFEIMGVPQGKTVKEWVRCFERLSEICDVIGLPVAQFGDRSGVVRNFLARNVDDRTTPRIHLLGLWSPHELGMYKGVTRVQSIDTSLPFKYAERGWMLEKPSGWIGVEIQSDAPCDWKMDWEAKWAEGGSLTHSLKVARHNFNVLRERCESV